MCQRIACLFYLLLILPLVCAAQACGKAPVQFSNPEYYPTTMGIVTMELPAGWFHDTTEKNPYYLIKKGESYNTAKTLMYVEAEPLAVTFGEAIKNDVAEFRQHCEKLTVENRKRPVLLEKGCPAAAQIFTCTKSKGSYVDLDTKIAINGLLLNVVLSAESRAEVEKYRADYDFLLLHITNALR